jgi:hypothetical protein
MPGQSVTQIIGGPAIITYRGATLRSKGDITLETQLETFAVNTSLLEQVDERVSQHPITIRFVPDGEWSNLGVLFPYQNTFFGDFVTPVRTLGSITDSAASAPNHNLTSGDAVVPRVYGGTIMTGLTAGVTYYVYAVSPDALKFMVARADAVAGTNAIAISAGTGITKIAVNNPLTIQTVAGRLLTFYNCAVTQMPGIVGSSVQTLLDEVTFEAFLADQQDWVDSNSLFQDEASPWPGDTSFDPDNILTAPIVAVWGGTAPWNSISTKNGWRVNFEMTLEPIEVDNVGLVTRRFSGLVVTARAIPVGITESDLMTAIKLQGSGAARGRSLGATGTNLDLSASGFFLRLYQAALRGGPQMFSSRTDRVGELTWVATRSFSSGIAYPLFYVGTSTLT